MKAKVFLSAVLAATLGFGSAQAAGPNRAASQGVKATADETTEYVDVTALYATNAGFDISSDFRTASFATSDGNNNTTYAVTGWTFGSMTGWHGAGVLEIGSSYTCNSAAVPSTNANGEKSGGALGLTAAWGGNAQYTQAVILPVGSYEIEFAVYGTQGLGIGGNLFGYEESGGTAHYGTTTTFTKGSWTNEKVSFTLNAPDNGKLSVGYKGLSKGSTSNDKLFVDYVKIYQDKSSADTYFKGLVTAAQTNAKEVLDKTEYTGTEKTELETLANQEMPSTYEEMVKLANNINKGIAGLTYAPNVAKIKSLLATYTTNVTDKLSTSCSGNVGTNKGEHWSGNSATTYYDSWSGSASDVKMTFNEVTLPVGKYALFATGRANTANPGYLSVKVGDNDALTTTLANNNSVGLGVDTDGNPNASYDGTYANNGNGYGWQWSAVEFEVTDATQKVVVSFGASLSNTWFGVSDFKLYAQSVDTKEVLAELDSMKALAKEQLEQTKAYYTGDEYTALSKLVEKDNPTAYDEIVANTNELIAAMTALQTAGMPAYVNAVKKSYAFDVTAKLGDMTKWTGDMVQNAGGQHWSGDASRGYWEQEGGKWSTSSWTTSWKFEDVELPAGKYVLLATGRGSEYTESYMKVITENGLLVSETDFPTKGDTGLGVDVNGYATISADSTYTNNNAGRGWEYRAYEFELSEAGKVSFEIGGKAYAAYQWISISDLQLLSDQDIYRDDNKAALQTACDNANAYLNKMFGKEAFQVKSDEIAADVKNATETAKADIDGTSATSTEFIKDKANVESAMTALLSTIATQKPALVAPEDGQLFNIVITDNDTYNYNGNAVTFKTNSSVAGGYSMGYNAAPGSPYLQAVSFESAVDTDNPNRYYLAFTDASGVKRYVGTGANYSGNNNQLRVVDSKDKAVLVNVELETSRVNQNGVYRLFNVAANAYISANNDADQGFYTAGDNNRKSFSIIAAEKATVEVKVTDAKWATFIAPFEAELPEGVTAYSCSSADTDNNLQLVEAEKLSANTPYILYADNAVSANISGYGLATAATYTEGALTGTFEKIENVGKDANRYVLQQQTIDDAATVAFFLVKTDDVWCDAYRAYLTMTSANGVTAFTFGGQKVDGIGAAFQGDATEVARYNAAGLRIAAPVKGVNIVKYSDGRVVKQIVK